MAKFIFVRHGQSQANADGILADKHSTLTEKGIEQARQTGNKLKGFPIKTITCSPYLRAQQTAEIIAGELGIDLAHIKIIDELHERDLGSYENKPKTRDSEWYETTEGEVGMERRGDIIKRMQICLEKIQQESRDGLVLAVGHSGSAYYLLQVAQGHTRYEDFGPRQEINNADIIEVEI